MIFMAMSGELHIHGEKLSEGQGSEVDFACVSSFHVAIIRLTNRSGSSFRITLPIIANPAAPARRNAPTFVSSTPPSASTGMPNAAASPH
jgi:hypothetical protein